MKPMKAAFLSHVNFPGFSSHVFYFCHEIKTSCVRVLPTYYVFFFFSLFFPLFFSCFFLFFFLFFPFFCFLFFPLFSYLFPRFFPFFSPFFSLCFFLSFPHLIVLIINSAPCWEQLLPGRAGEKEPDQSLGIHISLTGKSWPARLPGVMCFITFSVMYLQNVSGASRNK